MKTILHCIDTTGPGGAETVFIDLATRLPRDQYRAVVLIRGSGWVYDELVRRGVEPVIMDAKGSFNWRYLLGLAALIRRRKIDIIQSHLLGSNVYCSLAGLITRRPVVATFHGAVDIGLNERFKALKFGAINLGARAIIAVSEHLRRDIVDRTPLKTTKTSVIYNGIRTSDFQRPHTDEIRRRFGWNEDDIVIGCLGNIRAAKGYDILLQAAALLKDRPRYRFVIAGHGKGGLFDGLLKQRKQLELESTVQFLGFNEDPAGFLAGLDLFLLPSTSEGFSIATIQAMAAGLPVIVTRSGGPEEIVTHGVNGWMIEPGSPDAIVAAVEDLSSDRARMRAIASTGRRHAADTFDLDTMLIAYRQVYEKITGMG